jgi:hypothetical protein
MFPPHLAYFGPAGKGTLTSLVSANFYFYNRKGHYFMQKRMLTYLLSSVFLFYRYKKTAETSGK